MEYVDGIKVPLPIEIGISEVPTDTESMRLSGRAFLRYFIAHEDRVKEFRKAGKAVLKRYKKCQTDLEDLREQLEDARAKAQSKKSKACKAIRKEIWRHETKLKTIMLQNEVASVAWCEGYIRYCEVSYNVYVLNNGQHGNDALALLVGEYNLKSPYGRISLKKCEKIGLKRFRDTRTEELQEIWAARAATEAAEDDSEGDTVYETSREEFEEDSEEDSEWNGFEDEDSEQAHEKIEQAEEEAVEEAEEAQEVTQQAKDEADEEWEGFVEKAGDRVTNAVVAVVDTLTLRHYRKNRKLKHAEVKEEAEEYSAKKRKHAEVEEEAGEQIANKAVVLADAKGAPYFRKFGVKRWHARVNA